MIIIDTINSVQLAKILNKQHKNLLRDIRKINLNIENKDLILESKYVDKNKRTFPCYLINPIICQILLNRISYPRNIEIKKKLDSHFRNFDFDVSLKPERKEKLFIKELQETLNVLDIYSEKEFSISKYRIDLYIPKYKLAIEYDEDHHEYSKEQDKKREVEINDFLSCEFIRLKANDSHGTNIGKVLKRIIKTGE